MLASKKEDVGAPRNERVPPSAAYFASRSRVHTMRIDRSLAVPGGGPFDGGPARGGTGGASGGAAGGCGGAAAGAGGSCAGGGGGGGGAAGAGRTLTLAFCEAPPRVRISIHA